MFLANRWANSNYEEKSTWVIIEEDDLGDC